MVSSRAPTWFLSTWPSLLRRAKKRPFKSLGGQHTKQSGPKIIWICTLILSRSSWKECQQPPNRTGIRKTRVQMLTWPVDLISCGLGKATDLCEWAMLGSPQFTMAAVVHPAYAETRTFISFLRSALELLQPTLACWDPQPVTSGHANMKYQEPNLWRATSTPGFPLQEAMSETILLLAPPSLPCLLRLPSGCPGVALNKSLIRESPPQRLLPGSPTKDQYLLKTVTKGSDLKAASRIYSTRVNRQNLAKRPVSFGSQTV